MATKKTVKKTTRKTTRKRQKQEVKVDKRVIAIALFVILNFVGFKTGGIFMISAILIDLVVAYFVYRKYLRDRINFKF